MIHCALIHCIFKGKMFLFFRDEVKEIILILVKIRALNQAESFIEEYHLDHLKSLINQV